ncbi:hypothetical protein [Pseudomonas sp. R2-60-08W]|uniref:hypothetical protein n=1 Tax=Pseudomonas sp. R2-60-08W TaxID=1173280 RepID=UPI000F6F4048|nr:hypothetical protein [Pseudomonas sp. R2-60-08W]AZF26531.1 hypothetical protein C4J90_2358 [Pseudomonas sp. R2-60-08W]
MNPNFNQPLYSPPPAQSFGYTPADYERKATANMPSNMTSIYSNSAVAESLLRNFEYFSSGAAFVTRDSLIDFANRPLVDGGYHDQMTLLARDILGRDDLPRLFDGVQNGGQEDGLINQEDVELAINQLAQQGARGYRSAGYNGAMQQPTGEFGARYTSAMQQQRVNQQFAPAFCERPFSNGPRGMEGWDASPPAPRAFGAQQPFYAGMPVSQQWNPTTTGQRPYANDSNEALSAKVLSHFSNLQDPSTGTITDASLSAAASGYALDGRPISAADAAIAQELLERGQLFKTLDQGRSGTLDGSIARQDLGDAASEYRTNSNAELLQAVKDNFRQFTAGGTDDYVNVNELKEAAGLIPSDRTFSPQAREVALELLNRPGLLRELDIGVREDGTPGAEDKRFDMVNIDHMIKKESSPERAKPDASASVGNYSVAAGG